MDYFPGLPEPLLHQNHEAEILLQDGTETERAKGGGGEGSCRGLQEVAELRQDLLLQGWGFPVRRSNQHCRPLACQLTRTGKFGMKEYVEKHISMTWHIPRGNLWMRHSSLVSGAITLKGLVVPRRVTTNYNWKQLSFLPP